MTARNDDSEEADKMKIVPHVIGHQREQEGTEEIEGLDWDDKMLEKEIDSHLCRNLALPPADDDEAWAFHDDQQLNDMNIRLALCRIKAHKMLNGEELSEAELRNMYSPFELAENGYFSWFELDFEWYFDPHYLQFAKLQDYQRLSLRDTGEYEEWELYHNTCSTLESDREFVQFWEELSTETKWIKKYLNGGPELWAKMERVVFYQYVKILYKYTNIFAPLLWNAYSDYLHSVRFGYYEVEACAYLYLEIWKLVAKQKMNFKDALNQMKSKDLSLLCRLQVEDEINNYDSDFPTTEIRHNYYTYVAGINGNLTDGEAYKLVMEAVKKIVPIPKNYYDYAKQKLDIAEKIGLIPPQSPQNLNLAEQFRGR